MARTSCALIGWRAGRCGSKAGPACDNRAGSGCCRISGWSSPSSRPGRDHPRRQGSKRARLRARARIADFRRLEKKPRHAARKGASASFRMLARAPLQRRLAHDRIKLASVPETLPARDEFEDEGPGARAGCGLVAPAARFLPRIPSPPPGQWRRDGNGPLDAHHDRCTPRSPFRRAGWRKGRPPPAREMRKPGSARGKARPQGCRGRWRGTARPPACLDQPPDFPAPPRQPSACGLLSAA